MIGHAAEYVQAREDRGWVAARRPLPILLWAMLLRSAGVPSRSGRLSSNVGQRILGAPLA